ncbi:ArsR/SmtB family transcription factor [Streptomyces sp. NPDC003710]
MAYRIHFTAEDLARTRVATGPMPSVELDIAVRMVQERSHPVRFGAWRQQAHRRLKPQARMILDLIQPRGASPDFLGGQEIDSPEEFLQRVRSTPSSQVQHDLARIAERRALPAWVRRLDDDKDLLKQLWDTWEHVYAQLLGPYWPHIVEYVAAERAVRMRDVLEGGIGRLFAGLNPQHIRWEAPVLHISMASGFDADLRLEGQGLLLVPSVFGCESPVINPDAQPQPTLTYPACGDQRPFLLTATPHAKTPDNLTASLAKLLGGTRAAVLLAIAERPGCTTRELATTVGIAPASASEHATVLRAAGLIDTVRLKNMALHSPTSTGLALLNSGTDRQISHS